MLGDGWAILFKLDGRRTIWKTERLADAITFGHNLAALAGRGLRRD
jgi:hypothetical protein